VINEFVVFGLSPPPYPPPSRGRRYLKDFMVDSGLSRLVTADGNEYELDRETVSVGRSADNQISLASDSVSRHHAIVLFSGGVYIVKDLGSKNGTRINGELITGEHKLNNDDKVAFGDIKLTFKLDEDSETRTLTHVTPTKAKNKNFLELDLDAMQVTLLGKVLDPPLTLLEWRLLVLLYQNHGKVCSRDTIIETLYQMGDPDIYDSAIETLISRLRKRLQMQYPTQLPYIKAVRGVGYKLDI
jgi:pSer/pThr/pTyr-binding forkhead associated (FHA) protein